MYNLENKIAVVTGSSRGIGRATAVRLSKEGCKVVINYSKDEDGAKETQKMCKDSIVVKADVSKVSDCKKLVEESVKRFGKIDILVNNAGVVNPKEMEKVSEDDWDEILDTNLKSTFFLSKFAAEHMRRGGSIVNISSIRAVKTRESVIVYSASKAGVSNLTRGLALELVRKGIRVNAVAPGWIDTPMNANLSKEIVDYVKKSTPMGRMGEADEIANAVVFLASDEASYITGTTVFVDGGATIG